MNSGAAFKRIRFEKKLTQTFVAEKTGITQTYLSQIETGAKVPSQDMVNRLCKLYEIPNIVLTWLSTEEKDIKKNKRDIFNSLKPSMDSLILSFLK